MNHHEEREEHEGREGRMPEQFEALSGQVIGCAIEVHRFLGPGLLESSYQRCLSREWIRSMRLQSSPIGNFRAFESDSSSTLLSPNSKTG